METRVVGAILVLIMVVVYMIVRNKSIRTKSIRIYKPIHAQHLYIAEVQVLNAENKNVALPINGGFATQSSTSFGAVAERAIDGNTTGELPWMSATANSGSPYWQLDITPQVIKSITVHNTTVGEAQQEFLRDAKLVVYDESGTEVFSKNLTNEISQTIDVSKI